MTFQGRLMQVRFIEIQQVFPKKKIGYFSDKVVYSLSHGFLGIHAEVLSTTLPKPSEVKRKIQASVFVIGLFTIIVICPPADQLQ